MNKGKLIDADKLKKAINGFGNLIPKFVLDLIDELSEDERKFSLEEVLDIQKKYDEHIQKNFDPSFSILPFEVFLEQFKTK